MLNVQQTWDDPGLEETIWIERLSPRHGIVRSVLYQNLGVDDADVIIIDGAAITHHTYGDIKVPVFPHLATLVRQGYQLFDFAGTQDEPRQLAEQASIGRTLSSIPIRRVFSCCARDAGAIPISIMKTVTAGSNTLLSDGSPFRDTLNQLGF